MYINIDDIKERDISLGYSKTFDDFPVLEDMVNSGECDFTSPIDIKLIIKRNINVVDVKGNIETTVKLICSRCLEEYETFLVSPFSLTFVPEESEDPDSFRDEEIELSTYDTQVANFSGGRIDFKDPVQEQIVMAFPLKTLCRKSCKGLCSNCGVNMNDMQCKCENEDINPQFAALKHLKLDK